MTSHEDEYRELRAALRVILAGHQIPNEDQLPWLMDLATAVAEDYPELAPALVLKVVAAEVQDELDAGIH